MGGALRRAVSRVCGEPDDDDEDTNSLLSGPRASKEEIAALAEIEKLAEENRVGIDTLKSHITETSRRVVELTKLGNSEGAKEAAARLIGYRTQLAVHEASLQRASKALLAHAQMRTTQNAHAINKRFMKAATTLRAVGSKSNESIDTDAIASHEDEAEFYNEDVAEELSELLAQTSRTSADSELAAVVEECMAAQVQATLSDAAPAPVPKSAKASATTTATTTTTTTTKGTHSQPQARTTDDAEAQRRAKIALLAKSVV